MIECSPELIGFTIIVFGLTNIFLFLYSCRIHSSFSSQGKRYVLGPTGNLLVVGAVLGLQVNSTCHLSLITWGSITLALVFCVTVIESFLYLSSKYLNDQEVRGSESSQSSREQEKLKHIGTVITIGGIAGTVAKKDTRQQFYAPFFLWGTLQVGDKLVFYEDRSRSSGKHCVGDHTYFRYYCRPVTDFPEKKNDCV